MSRSKGEKITFNLKLVNGITHTMKAIDNSITIRALHERIEKELGVKKEYIKLLLYGKPLSNLNDIISSQIDHGDEVLVLNSAPIEMQEAKELLREEASDIDLEVEQREIKTMVMGQGEPKPVQEMPNEEHDANEEDATAADTSIAKPEDYSSEAENQKKDVVKIAAEKLGTLEEADYKNIQEEKKDERLVKTQREEFSAKEQPEAGKTKTSYDKPKMNRTQKRFLEKGYNEDDIKEVMASYDDPEDMKDELKRRKKEYIEEIKEKNSDTIQDLLDEVFTNDENQACETLYKFHGDLFKVKKELLAKKQTASNEHTVRHTAPS